jgi:hypothetical protein
MTAENGSNTPDCFGRLDVVFPKGSDGLRHSPPMCRACVFKTECLREAMHAPAGLAVESERVDRAYESRSISFLERWSRRKQLQKQRKRKTAG